MQTYESFITTLQAHHSDQTRRHAAFAELVSQFSTMALGYAYQLLGNEQMAQDAAQEAFLIAYQQVAKLREPAAFPGWLRRIVFTQCNRIVRAKRANSVPLECVDDTLAQDGDLAQQLADEDAAQALVDCVMAAVAALPDHERAVVRLFYFEGYSIREAAQLLNLPVTTVKKRLQYARERLRKQLMDSFKQGGIAIQSCAMQLSHWLLPLFMLAQAQPVLCPARVAARQVRP